MKPTSESPGAQEARYLSVAKGSCVSARASDELSEANDRPQSSKELNLFRPGELTSRRTGGICVKAGVPDEVPGMSLDAIHTKPRLKWYRLVYRVFEVGMVRRFCGLSKDPCLVREPGTGQSPHSSDEPSAAQLANQQVVRKQARRQGIRVTIGEAKEGRKVNTR
jgi:hypothetical protein